jgi:hypothetical protein
MMQRKPLMMQRKPLMMQRAKTAPSPSGHWYLHI